MSTSTTVAFVTGGNRGLGLGNGPKALGKLGITVVSFGVRDIAKGDAAIKEESSSKRASRPKPLCLTR